MADPTQRLSVYLPEELQPYKEDLEFFVSLMVRKLHTNRHKGTGVDLNPVDMLKAAEHEINESYEAIRDKGQFEAATECADVANFAFLAAMASLQMTRQDFKAMTKESLRHAMPQVPPGYDPPRGGDFVEAVLVDGTKIKARVHESIAPNGEDQQ